MFKVGDKVRYLGPSWDHGPQHGDIGTVIDITTGAIWKGLRVEVEMGLGNTLFSRSDNFELYTAVVSEEDQEENVSFWDKISE
jgi:hypothetical protein